MTTVADARINALHSLVPAQRLRLSDWIENNVRLPEGISALSGAVRLWPYQKAIADAFSDPTIERVSVLKASRIGYTILLNATVGGSP